MKRCPKCNRTYSTDTQKFCTHDGGLLFLVDEGLSETIQFDSSKVRDAVAKPTTRDLMEQKPAAFDPETTVVRPRPEDRTQQVRARDTGSLSPPQPTQYQVAPPPEAPPAPVAIPPPPSAQPSGPTPPPPTPAPLPPTQVVSAPIAPPAPAQAPPSAPIAPPPEPVASVQPSQPLAAAAPAKKKSKLPLILGIVAVVLVLFVGVAVVAGYFLILKPRQEAKPTIASEPVQTAPSLPTTTTTTEASKPSNEPPPYNPPGDAVQFVNSKDNLSDKLAEHYVDFSFYYPNRWEKDPKAGTGDSPNFVEVHRQLPPNFPQESVAVGWYDLQGEDHSFADLAQKKSAQLQQTIGEYRKIFEGPAKVGNYDGYELRFEGRSPDTEKGQLNIWGRVVWLPLSEGSKTGVALLMFATSLTPDVHSINDVGVKGELPMILESFRFGK